MGPACGLRDGPSIGAIEEETLWRKTKEAGGKGGFSGY
jgi:hypothetical protein